MKRELPLEIKTNELPKDNYKTLKKFSPKELNNNNSGFADACFLGAAMLLCFMWGMLVAILK